MKIEIICSDPNHPVIAWLDRWAIEQRSRHDIRLIHRKAELEGGDILFLVSCSEIIEASIRDRYRHVFVLHASDLPEGRGWSPHVWAILGGAETVTVSLLDAEDKVDTGAIWAKRSFQVPKHALFDEIGALLFETEIELMSEALALVARSARPTPQPEVGATYWERRRPEHSELDPQRSLADLFDQIRVADPVRYPAFFRLHGATYTIELKKKIDTDA